MIQNSKLEKLVDKSSVEAVDQALKEKEAAIKKAEQEVSSAAFREKKARRDAKQEVETIKKKSREKVRKSEDTAFVCFITALLSLFLALAKNEVLIEDVVLAVTVSFGLLVQFAEWWISPGETIYDSSGVGHVVVCGTGEAWFERIMALGLIFVGIIIVGVLGYYFCEEYKKQWNYASVLILAITMSVLITVGDIIRSVLPVNLIFLFAAVIVITTELRKKIRS